MTERAGPEEEDERAVEDVDMLRGSLYWKKEPEYG